MTEIYPRPTPIRTDASNAFANNTMRVRVPAIIREIQTLNPDLPGPIQAALDQLHGEIAGNALIRPLSLPAPDLDDWVDDYAQHTGERWHETQWFFAETYTYRLIMEAVRWWETGRDPFAPKKDEELNSETMWYTVESGLSLRALPVEQRLPALIVDALWGNRIDLSFAPALAHGAHWTDDDLLVGDHDAVAEYLLRERGVVHIIHDNAGTELAMDLVLADTLLDGVADQVVLHLKMHPTFVSDATLHDLTHFLNLLASGARGEAEQALGRRLWDAFVAGRLRFAPDLFWNSSRFLWQLPPRLETLLRDATLVIVKGDANYRRAVGDAIWPYHTPMSEVMTGFPAPTLFLRTLKSDPIAGLPAGLGEQLDAGDDQWRVNGRRGVIQASWR